MADKKLNQHEEGEVAETAETPVASHREDTKHNVWERIKGGASTAADVTQEAADVGGTAVTKTAGIAETVTKHGMNVAVTLGSIGATMAGGTMRLLSKTRKSYRKARGTENAPDTTVA